ncbi:MAG: phosphonate ABC transporter, permease protein PhnE [Halanaerobiaceae bacterium]
MSKLDINNINIPEKIKKIPMYYYWLFGFIFLTLMIFTAWYIEMRPLGIFTEIGNVMVFIKGFLEPSFTRIDTYLLACLETLAIALWGTFLAAITAIPLGLLGASNMSPNSVVYYIVRRILDLFRAVDILVFALIFVVAVGLGPYSGMMALAIHTTGILGKLLSETIESIDKGQVEGIKALGNHHFFVTTYGVIPQVLPNYLSYVLLRFESNVRAATVVGLVGGGGIGFHLWENMRSFQDSQSSTIILLIILMVIIIDSLSKKVRERFI